MMSKSGDRCMNFPFSNTTGARPGYSKSDSRRKVAKPCLGCNWPSYIGQLQRSRMGHRYRRHPRTMFHLPGSPIQRIATLDSRLERKLNLESSIDPHAKADTFAHQKIWQPSYRSKGAVQMVRYRRSSAGAAPCRETDYQYPKSVGK